MPFALNSPCRLSLFGLLATLVLARAAFADDHHSPRVQLLPKYKNECASCHEAFAPGMLPAESWRRLMNNLPKHFGTDASLDPATLKELTAWLATHAGTGKYAREEPPEDRITRAAWFVRKHREVSSTSWKSPAVKSAANCGACHTGSDQGDFNEHGVRIPR
ncbi:MAG: diheme cytochrome c [Proteobacteria bacterium]|nr:diheme cytochrome c [Pseudomonadota bacterium]